MDPELTFLPTLDNFFENDDLDDGDVVKNENDDDECTDSVIECNDTEAVLNDAVEFNRRVAAYSYSDRHFYTGLEKFLADSRFETRKGWTPAQIRAKLRERNMFIRNYIITGTTDDLPENWSISEPLMFSNVVCNGYGGTGKTTAMNNFHMRYSGITPTAPTNQASRTYIADLTRQTQPYAYDHTYNSTTWFKSLPIKFADTRVRQFLNTLGTNEELQASFTKLLNVGECSDIEATTFTREHTHIVLKHIYPLVLEMVHERITEFVDFDGHRFRLTVDGSHALHQPLDETFPVIRDFVEKEEECIKEYMGAASEAKRARVDLEATIRATSTSAFSKKRKRTAGKSNSYMCKDSPEELISRRDQARYVLDQDAYRTYVMLQKQRSNFKNQRNDNVPPPWVLNYILLSEEDGRSVGVMELLAKIDMIVCNIIYNPPYQHDRVPTYISSGSTTQSSSINSAASPLQMLMCPARARDVRNTSVWQSECFRRASNSFTCPDTQVYRTVCQTLEGNLPPDKHTYLPLLFREEFPSRVIDPAHQTNGIRFFFKHKDVSSYNKSMETRECTNTCISDLLFVSSDVVLLYAEELKRTNDPHNPYGVSLENISTQTEEQAQNNRARFWARKRKFITGLQLPDKEAKTSINLIATARPEPAPDVHGFTENDYSRVMRAFCTAEEGKDAAVRAQQNKLENGDSTIDPDKSDASLFTDDVIKEISYGEYAGRAGRSKMYTRRQNAMNRHKTGTGIAQGATVRMSDDDSDSDDYKGAEDHVTKVFVAGPAHLMLSRAEHMSRRIYADAIRSHLGTGKRLAEQTLSSRGVDHEAEFVYDPQHDIVIEYATPNWNMLGTNVGARSHDTTDWEGFKTSIAQTSSGCMMHMLFKRPRRYSNGCTVSDEQTGTNITLRGVQSTIERITESHLINHVAPLPFRLLVMASLVDSFRRWLFTQHLTADVNLMKHSHEATDELIDAILERSAVGHADIDELDHRLVVEYQALISQQLTKAKGTVDPLTGKRLKTALDLQPLLERFTRWLLQIRERHGDFSRNHTLTLYVDNHPLHQAIPYALRPVSLNSFFGADTRLLGNGFHQATELERNNLPNSVPSLNDPPKWGEYGGEGYFEAHGLMKSVPQMIQWTARSWFPTLMYEPMATILLGNMLIATNVPKTARTIKWTNLFTHTGNELKRQDRRDRRVLRDRFGLMTRSQSASIRAADATLHHQFFRMKAGELNNCPRPFVLNGSRADSCTNVIVKTLSCVYPFAKHPRLRINNVGEVSYITDAEYDRLCSADLNVTKIETSVIVPYMNPFVVRWGTTVDSSQGQTCRGVCLLDMRLVTSDHYLVALTRANDTRNTFVSNVHNAMQEAEYNCTQGLKLELLRKRCQRAITGRWEHFR